MELESLPPTERVSRPFSPAVIQAVTPRVQVPEEIYISLKEPILKFEGDAFIQAILDWKLTTIYCINFNYKDMMEVFDRVDHLYREYTEDFKKVSSQEDLDKAEIQLERLLTVTIQLFQILRPIKFGLLFKSTDYLSQIFTLTHRLDTLSLVYDLILLIGQTFRKKDLLIEQIKSKMFQLVCSTYLSTLHFNSLASSLKYDIFKILPGLEDDSVLSELISNPEITIDTAREYHLPFDQLEELDYSSQVSEKTVGIKELLETPPIDLDKSIINFCSSKLKLNVAPNSPLFLAIRLKVLSYKTTISDGHGVTTAILALKASSVMAFVSDEKFQQKYVSHCMKLFPPMTANLTWEMVEKMLTMELPSSFHSALLTAKWSHLHSSAFNLEQMGHFQSIIQKTVIRTHRLLQKEQEVLGSAAKRRKRSVENLESIIKRDSDDKFKPLFASTEESFITGLLDIIRESFLFEDRSLDNGIQTDYSQVFDTLGCFLQFFIDEKNQCYKYSLNFLVLIIEILKLDMGACTSTVSRLLNLVQTILKNPILQYRLPDGSMKAINQERLNEYLAEIIELADNLFVEPTKNFYISNISQFAREAAEHPIWNNLSAVPETFKPILNPVVVLLDDILTEMPENLVNPTLQKLTENGFVDMLIDSFLSFKKLDFEFVGFFILFMAKNINCPYKKPDFDEKLKLVLFKSFSFLLNRDFIKHNIKRFCAADSTNSLVVFAEELIDLVNVKHSCTEMIVSFMEGILQETKLFWEEFWKMLPKIIKEKKITEEEAPVMTKYGWYFTEDLKDNFLMLEKFSQNIVKFYGKFYDVQRTNLHIEFEKIEGIKNFLKNVISQPLFEIFGMKQRRFLASSFNQMVSQTGNENQQKIGLKVCHDLILELCDEYLTILPRVSSEDLNRTTYFLFRQNDRATSKTAFKDVESPERIINVLKLVNIYHATTIITELLKNCMIFVKSSFEDEEDRKLIVVLKKIIRIERSLFEPKVRWFIDRIKSWPSTIEPGQTEITFDKFSDYILGQMEMFTNEIMPKPFEKVAKYINNQNIEMKHVFLQSWVRECSALLLEPVISEDLTYENAFRYSKAIQACCYLVSDFNGISFLIAIHKHKILDFCTRAITFGLKFILHHKEKLIRIKSAKDTKKDGSQKLNAAGKPDICVKVSQELNDLKFVLENLCPKLMYCWKLIVLFFSPLQRDGSILNNSKLFSDKLNAARFKALSSIYEILQKIPVELIDVTDNITLIDPVGTGPENKGLHKGRDVSAKKGGRKEQKEMSAQKVSQNNQNTELETKENNRPGLTILLKNVSSGYDTLKHIHPFIQFSSMKCFELLSNYLTNINKMSKDSKETKDLNAEKTPQNNDSDSEKKKEETEKPQSETEQKIDSPQNEKPEEGEIKEINELKMQEESLGAEKVEPGAVEQGHDVEKGRKPVEEENEQSESLSNTQMVEKSKETLKNILDFMLTHKLGLFDGNVETFCTTFMTLTIGLDSNTNKSMHNLIIKLTFKLQELKSQILYKGEPKQKDQEAKSTQEKSKYRISRSFIKDFKQGNFNTFRLMKVVIALLRETLSRAKDTDGHIQLVNEQTQALEFLKSILDTFPKLLEIKGISMEPEAFRRRYSKIIEMITSLANLCYDFEKIIDQNEEEKNNQQRPSSKKANKKEQKNKEQKSSVNNENLRKEVIESLSGYLLSYPVYIKQKVNVLDGEGMAAVCNLLFAFSKKQPVLREAIKSHEILKRLCRAAIFSEEHGAIIKNNSFRAFVALFDDQIRTNRLIEESLIYELVHYFDVHSQAFKKIKEKTHDNDKTNSHPDFMLKAVPLVKFEQDFQAISSAHFQLFSKLTIEKCTLHKMKGENYISLKNDLKLQTVFPDSEATAPLIILLKEIVRASAGILLNRQGVPPEKAPIKSFLSLTHLVETLSSLVYRYPLLLKFVLNHNLLKHIKKIKNPWIKERFSKEIRENLPINYLQFHIRVVMFIDRKSHREFLSKSCHDSCVTTIDKNSHSKKETKKTDKNEEKSRGSQLLSVNSVFRKAYFKEVLSELSHVKDLIKILKTQKGYGEETNNELGLPNQYQLLRLCSTYCFCALDMATNLYYLKYVRSEGEINLYLFQRLLSDCVESFSIEERQVYSGLYKVLSRSLFILMKINFLCNANKPRLEEFSPLRVLTNPESLDDKNTLTLSDFGTLRADWPGKSTHSQPSKRAVAQLYQPGEDAALSLNYRESDSPSLVFNGFENEDFDEDDDEDEFDTEEGEFDEEELERVIDGELDGLEDDLDGLADSDNMGPELPVMDIEEDSLNTSLHASDDEELESYFYHIGEGSEDSLEAEFDDAYMDIEGEEEEDDDENDDDAEDIDNDFTEEQLLSIFDSIVQSEIRPEPIRNQNQSVPEPLIDQDDNQEQENILPILQSATRTEDLEQDITSYESYSSYSGYSSAQNNLPGDRFMPNRRRSSFSRNRESKSPSFSKSRKIEKSKKTISDSWSEVASVYPFLERRNLSGDLWMSLNDNQLSMTISTLEQKMEEWEKSHNLDKYSYKDMASFLSTIREACKKDQEVARHLVKFSPRKNKQHPQGNSSGNHGIERMSFERDRDRLVITNWVNNTNQQGIIMTNLQSNPASFLQLVQRQLDRTNQRERRRRSSGSLFENTFGMLENQDIEAEDSQEDPDLPRNTSMRNESLISTLLDRMQTEVHEASSPEHEEHPELTRERRSLLPAQPERELRQPFSQGLNSAQQQSVSLISNPQNSDPLGIAAFTDPTNPFYLKNNIPEGKTSGEAKKKASQNNSFNSDESPVAFPFESLSLSVSFLEDHNIDRLFFSILSFKDKIEVIRGFISDKKAKNNFEKKVSEFLGDVQNSQEKEKIVEEEEEMIKPETLTMKEENQPQQREVGGQIEAQRNAMDEELPENQELNKNNKEDKEPSEAPSNAPLEAENEIRPAEEAAQEPAQPAGQNADNISFINSLLPEMRAEVLMTCPNLYLESLTQAMRDEAAELRRRGQAGLLWGNEGNFGFEPPNEGLNGPEFPEDDPDNDNEDMDEEDGFHDESSSRRSSFSKDKEDKQLNQIDASVFLKINKTKEAFIINLINDLYQGNNPKNFDLHLFSVTMANYANQTKIYDTLLFLLEQPDLDKLLKKSQTFPPRTFSVYPAVLTVYSEVYQCLSHKILILINELVRDYSTFFLEQKSGETQTGPVMSDIQKIRASHGIKMKQNGFCRVVELLQIPQIVQDKEMVKMVLSIIYNILTSSAAQQKNKENKLKEDTKASEKPPTQLEAPSTTTPTLNKPSPLDPNLILSLAHISLISSLLTLPSSPEPSSPDPLTTSPPTSSSSSHLLSAVVSGLCRDSNNLEKFIQVVKESLNVVVTKFMNRVRETKELIEMGRNTGILGTKEFNNIVNFRNLQHSSSGQSGDEQIVKIFKTIEQLFEKYFESFHNSQKKVEDPEKKEEKEEETSSEETNRKLRARFSHLLEDQNLFLLWVDLIEVINIVNQLSSEKEDQEAKEGSNNPKMMVEESGEKKEGSDNHQKIPLKDVHQLIESLHPLIKSFFINFKILRDDDHISGLKIKNENKKGQKTGNTPKAAGNSLLGAANRKKSVCIADFVEEEQKDETQPLESSNLNFAELRTLNSKNILQIEDLFSIMCQNNKTVINYIIQKDQKLLSSSLACILKKLPMTISFENKRLFFKKSLKKLAKSSPLTIRVRRDEIFLDSFNQFMKRQPKDMMAKMGVEFSGEEGNDAGGITREWFLMLSKELFNANYCLFQSSPSGETFQPSPHSSVNPDHIRYYRFIGLVVGKALFDGYLLDAFFTRSFYKHIVGESIEVGDMEDIDPGYYKNLKWVLENSVEGLDLAFSYEADEFGKVVVKDLKPDGRNIPVTDENKAEYVNLFCYAKMATEIKEQIEAFLEGLEAIIPKSLLSIFDHREIELMISGMPEIDINDLKNNTEYINYTKESEAISWFWKILEGYSSKERANFLQFVTGTSKVPLEGFGFLKGIGGQIQRFQIHKVFNNSLLPTAHTCLNQLELPEYETFEKMKKAMDTVIELGREGFGFA